MNLIKSGLKISGNAIAFNVLLASIKISTGIVGNSYALIADGIESSMDIVSSLVVWISLRFSVKPPDREHPYGHGKAESLAGAFIALSLLIASGVIIVQSIKEIRTPHHAPAWYTLIILGGIILVKELLFRRMSSVGEMLGSSALRNDAWHHRSDALTSFAAFIGISIALIGGKGFEAADDWAALFACAVIIYNGVRLLIPALNEIMDSAVPEEIESEIRQIASQVEGVLEIEKCRIRKSGLGLLMDIHIVVDGEITVRNGHRISHEVTNKLKNSKLEITDITVHIEPDKF